MNRFPRDPWRLLLLLGFLCQGFACNSWVIFPALYGGCWYAAWKYRQPVRRVSEELELLILLGALGLTWMMRFRMDIIWFAAIGNGLVVFQILRSYFPPPPRQKMMTAAVAVTQIAIGAQAVFDYRFVVILAAAIVLIPRCLHQLEGERLVGTDRMTIAFPRKSDFLFIAGIMVVFFLFFPRIPLSPAARGGLGLPTGPQRPDLDMSEGGTEGNDSVIFRIEGEDLEYVRSFAMDHFDGVKWSASPLMGRRVRAPNQRPRSSDLKRTVRVHAFGVTRNYLPSEAHVIRIRGSMPYRVYVGEHGGMMMDRRLRAAADYEYWVRPDRPWEPLTERDVRRYTEAPAISATVKAWLDETLEGETDPRMIATRLTERFRASEFVYEIGSSRLNEATALEDFITQKRGHCGRYASALGALLRAKGIPCRVVSGFLARELNELGGFYSVRAKHAHAWTEVWLGDEWVRFDATPDGGGFEMERISATQTAGEWIEYMWYNRIVNFGFREQESLLSGLNMGVQGAAKLVFSGWPYALVVVLILAGIRVLIYWVALYRRRTELLDPEEARKRAVQEAVHFYGQMVRALARYQLRREIAQTPVEFLKVAESADIAVISEVRMITDRFCRVRYAEAPLTEALRQEVADALIRIRKS